MNQCTAAVSKIDWPLLREQKLYCLNEADNNPDAKGIYEGIIALMDAIQDAAVIDGLATEEEVFGDLNDE